ncbi:MAG: serine/threonine-protein kinase [Polyangiales bacterium]
MSERRLARYRLLRRIGAGGMAEVFRAELEGAEGVTRELVVKRIHGALAQDPEAVAMFVDEARIAARLRHPNIVQVYEFGRDADDYFLAMELVDGCDLATLIRSWHGSPAPMGVTAWVVGELLEALEYLHGLRDDAGDPLGLVHRDVSPHNVLLGASGEVKLADFGIARAARRVGDPAGDAKVKGKLAFMAPEQCRGDAIDARADLFGAGAVLYELLCGARPYRERDDRPLAEAVRAGDIVPLRERAPWVSDELAEVVARAVAADPDARFPDARAFHDALERAFAVDAVRAERGMLASTVRSLEGARAAPPAALSERTLTAEDEVAVPEAVAPEAPPPPPPSRTRRLAERGAMAVAVFVVALLAERRTRPAAPRPPPAAEPAVTLALDLVAARATAALRRDLEARCAARIAVVDPSGAARADLALLAWRDFAPAATRFAPLDDELSEEARARAVRTGRALGVSVRSADDAPAAVRFVPLGVDPAVFFARRDALAALAEAPESASHSLRATLSEALGGAPRGGRVPSGDLDGWGSWELASASVTLRRSGFGAYRVWVAAGATAAAAETWTARAASHEPESASELRSSHGLTSVLGWDRALQSLDLLSIGAELTDDDPLPPERSDVAFGWAPLSRLRRVDASRWRLARMPRGDDWRLDARGEPLRLGAHVVPSELLGWVSGLSSLRGRAARCVLGRLTSPAALDAAQRALGLTEPGTAPTWAVAAMEPALREALTASRLLLLRDGSVSPSRRREAWWTLWRDSVLGSARGTPSEELRLQESWRERAGIVFARAP